MKRSILIIVVIALAASALAGLFAANMGFKLRYDLLAASEAGSFDGTNSLGLPFLRMTGLNTADALIADIGSAEVQNVQRYVEETCSIEARTSGGAGPNFSLVTGEGYFVKMSGTVPYSLVGTHDPGFALDLDAATEPDSCDGTTFYAYPYHSSARKASELIDDIGSSSVQNVQRYQNGMIETHTAAGVGPDFDLTPGKAYFIKMNTTVSYVPSHY